MCNTLLAFKISIDVTENTPVINKIELERLLDWNTIYIPQMAIQSKFHSLLMT